MKHIGLLYLVVLIAVRFWPSSQAPICLRSLGGSSRPFSSYEAPSECGFEGNPDFYGLGIRLGIYLQWISSFLANIALKDAIAGTLETNFIFLLAVSIALADSTRARTVQSAEVIVLLQLCFGFILSTLTIWGHRTRSRHTNETPARSLAGSFARLGLIATISAYSVWFWFPGIELLASPPCPAYVFLFSMLDARGPLRKFYQIQSCIVLGIYGILFFRESVLLFCFLINTVLSSAILAGLSMWLSLQSSQNHAAPTLPLDHEQQQDKRSEPLKLIITAFFRRWVAFSSIIFWSDANGGLSAIHSRPSLIWVYSFLDVFIFIGRTTVQILCLTIFKRCPPIDLPPLLSIKEYKRVFIERPWKEPQTLTPWSYFPVKIVPSYWLRFFRQPPTIRLLNGICLVWAVTSVELTLSWNNISGVYDITSTGQLIPFVIGIVSLVRLCHALTVEGSSVRETDILMALLDDYNGPEPGLDDDENHRDQTKLPPAPVVLPGNINAPVPNRRYFIFRGGAEAGTEIIKPLKDGYVGLFWIRSPSRSCSLDRAERRVAHNEHLAAAQWSRNVRKRKRPQSADGGRGVSDLRFRSPSARRERSGSLSLDQSQSQRGRSPGSHLAPRSRRTSLVRHRSSSSQSRSSQSPSPWPIKWARRIVRCAVIPWLWPLMLVKKTKRGQWAIDQWRGLVKEEIEKFQKVYDPAGPPFYEPQRTLEAWGPHLRFEPLFTKEQWGELYELIKNPQSFTSFLVQGLDYTVFYAMRTNNPYVAQTAENFRRLVIELADLRRRTTRSNGSGAWTVRLKEQHRDAWELWKRGTRGIDWDRFLREVTRGMVEAPQSMPKDGESRREDGARLRRLRRERGFTWPQD